MFKQTDTEKINRLIHLSETNPILPDEFIPWEQEKKPDEVYMPFHLLSLSQNPLLKNLSPEQIEHLSRIETAQVMATYAWSETIGCVFFTEQLLKLTATSAHGKYVVQMMIEELRHQYMFCKAIEKLDVTPKPFSWLHIFISNIFLKWVRPRSKYIVVLAVEQVTDVYAKHFRKDPAVYSVVKKVSELHHIEEGRHMAYQKICLESYITRVGFVYKTWLGLLYILTIWFLRSQYIKKEFFSDIGLAEPKKYYKAAVKDYRKIFGQFCLKETIEYANSIGIINFITKPLWKLVLKAKF